MTNEELMDTWEQYEITSPDGNETALLTDLFSECLGEELGGVAFRLAANEDMAIVMRVEGDCNAQAIGDDDLWYDIGRLTYA